MHAFWLVLTYDLLEDWRMDDDSAQFQFDSFVILWTNHNSLLSIATNQIASLCIDHRLGQSAIFASVKVAKFEIKRLFFPLLYKTNRFHVAVRLSVIDHRGRQNVVRTSVTHFFVLSKFWHHVNMESIFKQPYEAREFLQALSKLCCHYWLFWNILVSPFESPCKGPDIFTL